MTCPTQSRVSAYDTTTVTLDSLGSSGDLLGRTVVAQGSPYVRWTATRSGTLSVGLDLVPSGSAWTAQVGDTTYGLVVTDGQVQGRAVDLEEGGTATWFAVPDGGSADALAALAGQPVASTLSYRIEGDDVSTTLGYATGGQTAFAVMPHQQPRLAPGTTCDLGTCPSIYGPRGCARARSSAGRSRAPRRPASWT